MDTIITLPTGFDVGVLVSEFFSYSAPFIGIGFSVAVACFIIGFLNRV